ncbi:MAG: FtsX-like permease family protein [Saprospiraceae bacterium]|nr:FtsX-like permease family protein [Saprospiraceae bacterium]
MSIKNNIKPPRWGTRLLEWLCKEELLEEIEGDLYEEFQERVERLGERRARWLYNLQAITFLRPFALKHFKITRPQNSITMLLHYFKIALRSFWQQKLSATINVLSLSLGIGCAILIFLFIQNEWSFDTFHEKTDQLYRINRIVNDKNHRFLEGINTHPAPFAPAVKEEMPEIQYITRVQNDKSYIKRGNFISLEKYFFTDADFFQMFSFSFVKGNAQQSLEDNSSAVITERIAEKFFRNEDPMGQMISVFNDGQYHDFIVKGIVKNPPSNSTFQFDVVLPFTYFQTYGWGKEMEHYWNNSFLSTYTMLSADTDLNVLHQKMIKFAKRHPVAQDYIESHFPKGTYGTYRFQPIQEVHFDNIIPEHLHPASQKRYSYILGGIGLIVLFIACINFTVLAIGRSSGRAKEIGIRKVVGARRNQVANQFLGESFLFSFFGLCIGLLLAYFVLPQFNKLADREFTFITLLNNESILFLIALTLVAGLVAGFYPALFISAFRPVESIKNRLKLGRTNLFTKTLVGTQFVLSIVLVIVTLVMGDQLKYLKTKDLGFDKEQLLTIRRNGVERANFFSVYRNELQDDPKIVNMSSTYTAFTYGAFTSDFKHEGKQIDYSIFMVGPDFLKTMGMQLLAGRDFNANIASDTLENIIVNEAFVKALGWKDPIGKKVIGLENAGYKEPTIVGVVKDFNFESLEHAVKPSWMLYKDANHMNDMVLRIRPENIQSTIQKLERIWKNLAPDIPFTYSFMDERMAAQYETEERWNNIIKFAGILAIFIAFFGMFGLVALSVAGRAKEMSIRKVFGASMQDIAYAISSQFAKLILIALVIASPIAWYLSNKWLQGFAYHVNVKPLLFILAFGLIAIVFIFTLLYHVLRTAKANPADTLRLE